MNIDWLIVATVAGPVIGVVIGVALDRALERKAKLIVYFTHAAAFPLPGGTPPSVHTHGIIVRNVGRKAATNISVRHRIRPSQFVVFPSVAYTDPNLPAGGFEIVFPRLVPGEQVAISYLYSPPLLYSQIHNPISHTDGFAREVSVLPQPQYPAWLLFVSRILLVVGIIALLYVGVMIVRLKL